MVCDDTKRVIVIKNIQSNVIEEAILVLKGRPDTRDKGLKSLFSKDAKRDAKRENAHILKEAEEIINKYMKENGNHNGLGVKLNLKPCRNRTRLFANSIVNIMLIGGIALLVFLVVKFI
jgi:hypothetical protein